MRKVLFLLPRVLILCYAVLLSLFSLDVFGSNQPLWKELAAFIIHSAPSVLVIVFTYLTWHKSLWAAILFFAIGVFFTGGFRTYLMFANFTLISFPIIVIAGLYALDYFLGKNKSE